MKMPMAIRVLVADDHPVVRAGLAALIKHCQDMSVVAEAANGREAVELALRYRPDIILMDLRMPEMSGVEAIQALRKEWPEVRVIVLTVFDGDEDIYRSLQAGAKAYLLKDVGLTELLECVHAVHAGKTAIPPALAGKLASRVSTPDLTPRELEVLHSIVEGKSNKEIAQALQISEGTVKVHVTHLLEKLGVEGRGAAISAALQHGIVHLPHDC